MYSHLQYSGYTGNHRAGCVIFYSQAPLVKCQQGFESIAVALPDPLYVGQHLCGSDLLGLSLSFYWDFPTIVLFLEFRNISVSHRACIKTWTVTLVAPSYLGISLSTICQSCQTILLLFFYLGMTHINQHFVSVLLLASWHFFNCSPLARCSKNTEVTV